MLSLYQQAAATDPVRVSRLNDYMRQGLLNDELYQIGLHGVMAKDEDTSRSVVSNLLSRIRSNPQLVQNPALMEIGKIYEAGFSQPFSMEEAAAQAAQGGIQDQVMQQQLRMRQGLTHTQNAGYMGEAGAAAAEEPPQDVFESLNEARRVEKAINVYMARPELFTVEHVRQLQEYADQYNLPFDPFPTPEHALRLGKEGQQSWADIFKGASADSIIRQGLAGAVEGLTTVPDESAGAPKNMAEEFARSIGHLLGFVGMGTHKSVPLLGAELASKALGMEKATTFVAEKLIRAGASGRLAATAAGMVGGSFNLGASMAISARLGGPSAMLDGFLGGAKAGAVFGSLRLLPGNAATMKTLGALAGAAYESVPTYREQGFTPQFMYDTLLGAYFGYKEGAAGHVMKSDPNSLANLHDAIKSDPNLAKSLQPVQRLLADLGARMGYGYSPEGMRRDANGNYDVSTVVISGSHDKETEMVGYASHFGGTSRVTLKSNAEVNKIYETLRTNLRNATQGKSADAKKYDDNEINAIIKEIRTAISDPENESITRVADAINARLRPELKNNEFNIHDIISSDLFDYLKESSKLQIKTADVVILEHAGIRDLMDVNEAFDLVKQGLGNKRFGSRNIGEELFDSITAGRAEGDASLIFVDGSGRKYMLDRAFGSSRIKQVTDDELHKLVIPKPGAEIKATIIASRDGNTQTSFEQGVYPIIKMLQKFGNQTHRELDSDMAVSGNRSGLRNIYTFALKDDASVQPLTFTDGELNLHMSYDKDSITLEMQHSAGRAPTPEATYENARAIREAFEKEFKVSVGVTENLGANSHTLKISRKINNKNAPAVSPEKILEMIARKGSPMFASSGMMGVKLDPRVSYTSVVDPAEFKKNEQLGAEYLNISSPPTGLLVQFNPLTHDGTASSKSLHLVFGLDGKSVRVIIPNEMDAGTNQPVPILNRVEYTRRTLMPWLNQSLKDLGFDAKFGELRFDRMLSKDMYRIDNDTYGGKNSGYSVGHFEVDGVNSASMETLYKAVAGAYGATSARIGTVRWDGSSERSIFVDPSSLIHELKTTQAVAQAGGVRVDLRSISRRGAANLSDLVDAVYGDNKNAANWQQLTKDARTPGMSSDNWVKKVISQATGSKNVDLKKDIPSFVYGEARWNIITNYLLKNMTDQTEAASTKAKLESQAAVTMLRLFDSARRTAVSGVPFSIGGKEVGTIKKAVLIYAPEKGETGADTARSGWQVPTDANIHSGDIQSFYENPLLSMTGPNMTRVGPEIETSEPILELMKRGFDTHNWELMQARFTGTGYNYAYEGPIGLGQLATLERGKVAKVVAEMLSRLPEDHVVLGMISGVTSPRFVTIKVPSVGDPIEAREAYRKGLRDRGFKDHRIKAAMRAFDAVQQDFQKGIETSAEDMQLHGMARPIQIFKGTDVKMSAAKAKAFLEAVEAMDPSIIDDPTHAEMFASHKWFKRLMNFSAKKGYLNFKQFIDTANEIRREQSAASATANGQTPLGIFPAEEEFGIGKPGGGLTLDIITDFFTATDRTANGRSVLEKMTRATDGVIYVRPDFTNAMQRLIPSDEKVDSFESGYAIKGVINKTFGETNRLFGKCSFQPMPSYMIEHYKRTSGKTHVPVFLMTGNTVKNLTVNHAEGIGRSTADFKRGVYTPLEDHYTELVDQGVKRGKFLRIDGDDQIQFVFSEHDAEGKLGWQMPNFIVPSSTTFRNDLLDISLDTSHTSTDQLGTQMRDQILAAYSNFDSIERQMIKTLKESGDATPEKVVSELLLDAAVNPEIGSASLAMLHGNVSPLAPFMNNAIQKAVVSKLEKGLFALRAKGQSGVGILSDEIAGFDNGKGGWDSETIYSHELSKSGKAIPIPDIDKHMIEQEYIYTDVNGVGVKTKVKVLDTGKVILPWNMRDRFEVGDKVITFRVPINRGSGMVTLEVVGFRGRDMGNTVKVNAEHVFRTWEGDLDIDKIFILRSKRAGNANELDLNAMVDLFGNPLWQDHNLQMPTDKFDVVQQIKNSFKKVDPDRPFMRRVFDLHSFYESVTSAGGGSMAIGQIANLQRVWAAMHQLQRSYEFRIDGVKYVLKPREAGEIVKRNVRYNGRTDVELNLQQYISSVFQAALDDVKYGGITNRKNYIVDGKIIENDLYFDRIEMLSRMMKVGRVDSNGKFVEIDPTTDPTFHGSSKVFGEMVAEHIRDFEQRANSVVNGVDPETGRKLSEDDILDYLTIVDGLKNMNEGERNAFFRDEVFGPRFFAKQGDRISRRIQELKDRHEAGTMVLSDRTSPLGFSINNYISDPSKESFSTQIHDMMNEFYSRLRDASVDPATRAKKLALLPNHLDGIAKKLGAEFDRIISNEQGVLSLKIAPVFNKLRDTVDSIERQEITFQHSNDAQPYKIVFHEASTEKNEINLYEAVRIVKNGNGFFKLEGGNIRSKIEKEVEAKFDLLGKMEDTKEQAEARNNAMSQAVAEHFAQTVGVLYKDYGSYRLYKSILDAGGLDKFRKMASEYIGRTIFDSMTRNVDKIPGLAEVMRDSVDNNSYAWSVSLPDVAKSYIRDLASLETGELAFRRRFMSGTDTAMGIRVMGTYGEDPMTKLLLHSRELMGFGKAKIQDSVRANREAAEDALSIRVRELKYGDGSIFKSTTGHVIVDSMYKTAADYVKILERFRAASWRKGEQESARLLNEIRVYSKTISRENGTALLEAVRVLEQNNEAVTNNELMNRLSIEFIKARASAYEGKDLGLPNGQGLHIDDARGLLAEMILGQAVKGIEISSPVKHSFRMLDVTKMIPGIGEDFQGQLVPFTAGKRTFIDLYAERFSKRLDETVATREALENAVPKQMSVADAIAQEQADYLDMEIDSKNLSVKIGGNIALKLDAEELKKLSPMGAKITTELLEILRDYPQVRSGFQNLVRTISVEMGAASGQGWQGKPGTGRIEHPLDVARVHNYLKHMLSSPDPMAKMVLGMGLRGHAFPENVANRLMSLSAVVHAYDSKGRYTGDKILTPIWSILDYGRKAFLDFASNKDAYTRQIEARIAKLTENVPVKNISTELRIAYNLLETGGGNAAGGGEYEQQAADLAYWNSNTGRQRAIQALASDAREMLKIVQSDIEKHFGPEGIAIMFPDGTDGGKGMSQAIERLNMIFGTNMSAHPPQFRDTYAPRVYDDPRKLKEAAYKYARSLGKPADEVEQIVASIMERHQRPDTIYARDGVINSDQHLSFFQHRGTEELGGYSRDLSFVLKRYFTAWARKKAMDQFALQSTYIMQSMKTGRGEFGQQIAERVAQMEKEFAGSKENWLGYMDRLVRNAIGYPSQGNEKYFGFDLNDNTWAPRFKKLYGFFTGGKELEDPHEFMKWVSSIEGSYHLMALLAFPKAMLNNLMGGHLNIIKRIGYADWKKAGVIAKEVMQTARDGKDIIDVLRRHSPNMDEAVKADAGMLGELQRLLTSPAILSNFTEFEAELSKFYDQGKIHSFKEDIRAGASIKEAAERHGIGEAIWKRMVQFGGSMFGTIEFKLRSRAFVAGYMHSYNRMGLPVDVSVRHGMDLVRKTQFLYDALSLPEFRNSVMGKMITRFQPWAWNQFRFEADIVKEAASVGFAPGTPEYERFTRGMSINAFVIAMAAFLPFSLFGSNVPPPYQYGYEAAEALWNQDLSKLFGGTLGISMLTGPTVNNFIIGPSLALMTDSYGWNPWSVLPFGRAIGATYRTIAKPQFGIDYWTGVPVMDLHKLVYAKEPDNAPKSIDTLMRSKPDTSAKDGM